MSKTVEQKSLLDIFKMCYGYDHPQLNMLNCDHDMVFKRISLHSLQVKGDDTCHAFMTKYRLGDSLPTGSSLYMSVELLLELALCTVSNIGSSRLQHLCRLTHRGS